MTLSAVFRWKHPDSTSDMNSRLQTLVPRGIFDGGGLTPGAGLTVNVAPLRALSYDGMLVVENATQTLTVAAGATNYVVIRAKYVTGTSPTVQWEVMTQAAYNADPDRNYLIVVGVVTLAGGAVAVALADVSFLARDVIDPMDRSGFRGITTFAALPAEPPEQNRNGDFYFVTDRETIYWWNDTTSAWEGFDTGSYNVETGAMGDVLVRGERNRIEDGSGVIGGVRPNHDMASEFEVAVIESPAVLDQVGIDAFSAVINGHYVQPYARYIAMPAKPLAGTRYDLIFLEVYREAIVVPENHAFPRNPDGTLTYTISQVSDNVEQRAWLAGVGGDNFDLNELQSDDHSWVVTKYRFGTVQAVGTAALYDNTATAAAAVNIDGINFAAAGATDPDQRIWNAAAVASSADGESWAIPLFVVKRTAAEDHTINDAIQEFRSNVRWMFPVYAVTDTGYGARVVVDSMSRNQPAQTHGSAAITLPPYEKPSGFMHGMDFAITNGVAANTIRIQEGSYCRIRMRGVEDHVRFVGSPDLDVLTPPGGVGYDRTLVYIKMSQTLYADDMLTVTGSFVSTRHRPYFPSSPAPAPLQALGYKRGFITYELVASNLGAASRELDEDDSMVAEGWTKGDASLAFFGKQYEDGGIWSRAAVIDADDRIHPNLYEWAIPVCLIHRRNTGAWTYNTNPNGTTATRPDDRTDATVIHADDLVDLRRLVDVDAASLKDMLEGDIDKLMKGTLRTRMAEKWAGTAGAAGNVAGSRILQTDIADVGAAGIGFSMPSVNATKKLWSDAKEFVPVSCSFDMGGNFSNAYVDFVWGAVTSTIKITAPPGSHICRHLPAVYLTHADSTANTYLQYESDPLFSTRVEFDNDTAPWPTPVEAKVIDATNLVSALVYTDTGWTFDYIGVSVEMDQVGRATVMHNVVDMAAPYAAGDTCVISFWVHYDRTPTGAYAGNYGLAEIPDEVHQVLIDPAGAATEVNVGTLYTNVRMTVTGLATIPITSADVAAASGLAGAHTIVGIDWANVKYSAAPGVALTGITLNNAQTQLDVTWAGVIVPACIVEFTIFFYTANRDKWVEVGKGGKSVRAFYSWGNTAVDLTGVGLPGDPYAFALNTSIWHNAEVADRFVPMPQLWHNNIGLAANWSLLMGPSTGPASYRAGYEYSNMVSVSDLTGLTGRYAMFVYPKWDAPAAAINSELLLSYSYSPYQGVSSTGGAKAVPVTAIPEMKKKLHGTIVENTDFFVSQAGATSVFGGVDGWTGWPARRPNVYLNFFSGRFGAYTQTQLVKGTKASGLLDFGFNADPNALMAGAILRLPFPQDRSMVDAGVYHKGTSDYDIDPGREGVNAGFFSYAPSYPGLLTAYGAGAAETILYDQFVNGIARLAIPGEPKTQSQSRLLAASAFQQDTSAAATDEAYDSTPCAWFIAASEKLLIDGNIDILQGHILGRTLTALDGVTLKVANGTDLFGSSGLRILHPFADTGSPSAHYDAHTISNTYLRGPDIQTLAEGLELTAISEPMFLGTAAGTVLAYYAYAQKAVAPALTIYWDSKIEAYTRGVFNTLLTIDSERTGYLNTLVVQAAAGGEPIGPSYQHGMHTDLIRIPMVSHSSAVGFSGLGTLSAYGYYNDSVQSTSSLKGREIAYPSTWGATTITSVDAHIQASELFHTAYGRGLYLGSATARKNMPVFVPGSGSPLHQVITDAALPEVAAQPPETYPSVPATSAFATSPRVWDKYDHGGPIAYAFYGLMINPSSDDFHGQIMMQITGGPTMGTGSVTGAAYTPDATDGTAVDAFFPSMRPLIKTGQ